MKLKFNFAITFLCLLALTAFCGCNNDELEEELTAVSKEEFRLYRDADVVLEGEMVEFIDKMKVKITYVNGITAVVRINGKEVVRTDKAPATGTYKFSGSDYVAHIEVEALAANGLVVASGIY